MVFSGKDPKKCAMKKSRGLSCQEKAENEKNGETVLEGGVEEKQKS